MVVELKEEGEVVVGEVDIIEKLSGGGVIIIIRCREREREVRDEREKWIRHRYPRMDGDDDSKAIQPPHHIISRPQPTTPATTSVIFYLVT